VILIDDRSTDDSVAVIKRYLPRFKNARLVRMAFYLIVAERRA
jgi:hypothetical protein